jgi:hypothetical protein
MPGSAMELPWNELHAARILVVMPRIVINPVSAPVDLSQLLWRETRCRNLSPLDSAPQVLRRQSHLSCVACVSERLDWEPGIEGRDVVKDREAS